MSSRSNCSGCPLPLKLDLNPIDSFGLLSETTPAVGPSPDNLPTIFKTIVIDLYLFPYLGTTPTGRLKSMAPMDTLNVMSSRQVLQEAFAGLWDEAPSECP